ncbi:MULTISPECIES: helix-turn-helix domain-containing protein [unclassified Aeromicrobium]|uniref:helix-turn-helix domain-containing protein n=1 Tax=unclassified Aeromicrobium TaxID=2633570 RepID=UPI00396B253A
MDIAVQEAAQRLGVSESRIRQFLAAGDLRGRRVGRAWLVDSDDVARLQGRRRRAGRPAGPKRAWAIIDILSGGRAPWLSPSERSQVRSYVAQLNEPDSDEWRSILRGRSELRPVRAHPAAVARLREVDHVLPAGPAEAARRGFDLVVVSELVPEFYLPLSAWDHVSRQLALAPSHDADIILRHPMIVWPFDDRDAIPDAALAADLLYQAEPRAIRAGQVRLNQLLKETLG